MQTHSQLRPRHRLIIRNFLTLKYINIEINDITILIGEQASGKSLICKLYYFLTETISAELSNSVRKSKNIRETKTNIRRHFASYFPEYMWKDADFSIELLTIICGDEYKYVNINNTKSSRFSIEFSEKVQSTLKSSRIKYKKYMSNRIPDVKNSLSGYLEYKTFFEITQKEGLREFYTDAIYIPSGRSFFSTIKDNVFGFLSENIAIDPFIKEFGKEYELAKAIFSSKQIKQNQKNRSESFDSMSKSILKGEILRDKDDYFIKGTESTVSLSYASSGQQEAAPLLIVLNGALVRGNDDYRKTIIIEEPETHLYPQSQKSIIDIVFDLTISIKRLGFVIATHSPYILACVNNCALKNKEIRISAFLVRDGLSIDIIDENGVIDSSTLDDVSHGIYNEFYDILENQQNE
jgi:predicted ATPase